MNSGIGNRDRRICVLTSFEEFMQIMLSIVVQPDERDPHEGRVGT